jgi:hypothetical protein
MGGLVKSLFGGGSPPAVAPAPLPPASDPDAKSAMAAAGDEEMRRRAAVGRQSTIFTNPADDMSETNVGKRVLLGA